MKRNLLLCAKDHVLNRRLEMWDLATIIAMNEKAYQEYLRKERDEKDESEKKVKVA